jgi:hypothetical protein
MMLNGLAVIALVNANSALYQNLFQSTLEAFKRRHRRDLAAIEALQDTQLHVLRTSGGQPLPWQVVSAFPALARTGVESALQSWCGACESMAHLAQEVSHVLDQYVHDQYVHELRASPLAFVVIDDAGTRPPVTSPERRKQAA